MTGQYFLKEVLGNCPLGRGGKNGDFSITDKASTASIYSCKDNTKCHKNILNILKKPAVYNGMGVFFVLFCVSPKFCNNFDL